MEDRSRIIVRTSMIGIAANILLAGFKAAVGVISGSIAVVLDAVNNLSDALSSVITIVGTKLAEKLPDKKHPLGYGRIEFLSAMIVSAIVLYAGITSLTESVKKIIHPEAADYSTAALIIIAAAVVVKYLLGRYVKAAGERVNSGSLIASGADAMNDSVISLSVFISAVIYLLFHLSLEAYVGVVIAVMIIRSGLEMLTDTLDEILGRRISGELSRQIKQTVSEDREVQGAYDLILHSYGPDRYVGSVHVEVRDSMKAPEIDRMIRRITKNVYLKHKVIIEGITIYSQNSDDPEAVRMKEKITDYVMSQEGLLQMHGFYADTAEKSIIFDIIIDFDHDRDAIYQRIKEQIQQMYPGYTVIISLDANISD
ncbi:MAG: cation diffusion facilitator family transporter [Solobacterium sp.]|nr:cation diffusion facilitator family transporter [Solobacterium sp.]